MRHNTRASAAERREIRRASGWTSAKKAAGAAVPRHQSALILLTASHLATSGHGSESHQSNWPVDSAKAERVQRTPSKQISTVSTVHRCGTNNPDGTTSERNHES